MKLILTKDPSHKGYYRDQDGNLYVFRFGGRPIKVDDYRDDKPNENYNHKEITINKEDVIDYSETGSEKDKKLFKEEESKELPKIEKKESKFNNYSVSREDNKSPFEVNYEVGKEKFDFPSNESLDEYVRKGTDLPGREDYDSEEMRRLRNGVKSLAVPSPENFTVYAGIRSTDDLSQRELISTSLQEGTANLYKIGKGSEGVTVKIDIEEGSKIISTFNSIDKDGQGDNFHFRKQGEIIIPKEGNIIRQNEDGSYIVKPDKYIDSKLIEDDKGNKVVELPDGKRAEFLSKKEYKKIAEDFATSLSDKELAIIQNYVDAPGISGELNAAIADKPSVGYLHNNTDTDYFVSRNELNKYYREVGEQYEEDVGPLDNLSPSWPDEKSLAWAGDFLETGASDSRKRDLLKAIYSRRKTNPYPDSDKTYYTDEEIKEAKEIYAKMKPLCDERRNYNLMNPKWDELTSQISQFTKDNKSEYYWQRIAEVENETVFDTRKYDFDKELESGNLRYIGAKEMYDRRDESNPQSSDYKSHRDHIVNRIDSYNKLFEEKGVTLDKDIIVFRRGRETSEQLKNGFTMYGLTSCTAFDNLPKKMPSGLAFGEQRDYILLPSGTKILLSEQVIGRGDDTGKNEDVYRGVRRQHEILLAPGTSFRRLQRDYNWQKDETNNLLTIEEGVNYYD